MFIPRQSKLKSGPCIRKKTNLSGLTRQGPFQAHFPHEITSFIFPLNDVRVGTWLSMSSLKPSIDCDGKPPLSWLQAVWTPLWPPWLSVTRPSHTCCSLPVFLTVVWQLVLEGAVSGEGCPVGPVTPE